MPSSLQWKNINPLLQNKKKFNQGIRIKLTSFWILFFNQNSNTLYFLNMIYTSQDKEHIFLVDNVIKKYFFYCSDIHGSILIIFGTIL